MGKTAFPSYKFFLPLFKTLQFSHAKFFFMKQTISNLLQICLLTFSYLQITSSETLAQVIPDNTVNTQVERSGNIAEITGGATRGGNLFHSFEKFSVPNGNEAFFKNAGAIENIFSRVTGGSISQIDGLIRANGRANLYLINPNGIIFGENASLNIGGSFYGSTASSIIFPDGEFSATSPETESILTINVPIGLDFGSNTGDITVRGKANNIFVEIPSFRINKHNQPETIQVKSGNNISLIGGNINFTGGGLKAAGGQIELGSVANNQKVILTHTNQGWVSNFEQVTEFQDISLSQATYIDTSARQGGNIRLNGKRIIIDDGSAILSNSMVSSNKELIINATELLEIKGSADPKLQKDSNSVSLIATDILGGSSGTGNNIEVNADRLRMYDGALIRSVNFSDFNSKTGTIKISSHDILIDGNSIDGSFSSLITTSTGIRTRGMANDITIKTDLLNLTNSGRIKADAFGRGESGNLTINAKAIQMSGNNSFKPDRRSVLSTRANNNSGKINIFTDSLKIMDGAGIITDSNLGNSGEINITAQDIELRGTKPKVGDFIGGISSSTTGGESSGNSSNINIKTNSLKVMDGSLIRVVSLGTGKAGNIVIDAEYIEVKGFDRFAEFPPDKRRISKINTDSQQSNGGNIILNSDLIKLNNFGIISASSNSVGNGGKIKINTQTLIALDNSKIEADALDSEAGDIEINTNGFFVSFDSQITASSSFGRDGTVGITLNASNIDLQKELKQLEGELVSTDTIVANSCLSPSNQKGHFTIGSSTGLPKSPDSNYSDVNFSLTGITLPSTIEQSALPQSNYWQQNPSPAAKMIRTKEGRVLLVAAPQKAEALFCQS